MIIFNIWNHFLNYVYPPKCIFCDFILEEETAIEICPACYVKINFLQDEDALPIKNFYPSQFCDGVFCLFDYQGFIREAIIKYKFFQKESFYKVFGILLAQRLRKYYEWGGFDAILAVPLHKNRLKERGYNQSLLIVHEISKELKVRDISNNLIRTIDTKQQSLLDGKSRKENIKNSINFIENEKIPLKNILIIDDILTTGSTLEECAKVLKEAGAKTVLAAVLASGRK